MSNDHGVVLGELGNLTLQKLLNGEISLAEAKKDLNKTLSPKEKTKEIKFIPELCKLTNEQIRVTFAAHEMPYGDERYSIPERNVVYELELARIPCIASSLARQMKLSEKEELNKIEKGEIALYKIVTAENVKGNIKQIGVVKVFPVKDKLSSRIYIDKENLKMQYANVDKVREDIQNKIKEIIKR